METYTPKWLDKLEKPLGWIAIPNLAILLITMQAFGFLVTMSHPEWIQKLMLSPYAVIHRGEFWRLFTFLALPLSTHPLFVIFVLLFLYFILSTLEQFWGAFKTTFYVLMSILVMIFLSFTLGVPITDIFAFETSLFFAAATLYPENEILFFFFPVKMKWLAWVSAGFIIINFFQTNWLGKIYLLGVFSNYLIFFGPAMFRRGNSAYRRWVFKNKHK